MKQFLKHITRGTSFWGLPNFLILLVLFFGYAAYALAATITRPYGSSDYAGGQKAVGSKVNSEFDNIVNWLNGGNIATSNIASLGVATNNIAANAVTFVKLVASNLLVTSSSSLFSNSGVTPATVTNLSTTITTTGHPVHVMLEPNPGTYLFGNVQTLGAYVELFGIDNVTPGKGNLFFVRDGATTAYFGTLTSPGGSYYEYRSCSEFSYTETSLAAGTYVISLKVSGIAANDKVFVVNCRLVVKEEL